MGEQIYPVRIHLILMLTAFVLAFLPHNGLADRLTAIAEKYRREAGASGLIIVVGKADQIVAAVASGTRASNRRDRVDPDDRVMIGSVSKPITAGFVARKVDQGVLTWNTTIQSVFPELSSKLAGANGSATIEQILCHRSGLDRPFAPTVAKGARSGTDFHRALVYAAFDMKPIGSPGEKYLYNSSAAFSAAMIEKLSGESYSDAMKNEFFTPLGLKTFEMGRPWLSHPDSTLRSEALVDGTLGEAPKGWNPQLAFDASGGWSCSLPELVQLAFTQTYNSKQNLISPSSLARLFQDPYNDGYCLGWSGRAKDQWRSHGGSTGLGDTTVLAIAPKKRLVFAFAFNRNTGDAGISSVRDRLLTEVRVLVDGL